MNIGNLENLSASTDKFKSNKELSKVYKNIELINTSYSS